MSPSNRLYDNHLFQVFRRHFQGIKSISQVIQVISKSTKKEEKLGGMDSNIFNWTINSSGDLPGLL